jgi:hypothetical protein
VTAGAVDVDVNEARDRGLASSGDFRGPGRQGHILARTYGFDYAFANQDSGVAYFRAGSECARDVQQNGGHGQVNILAEISRTTKRNGRKSIDCGQ